MFSRVSQAAMLGSGLLFAVASVAQTAPQHVTAKPAAIPSAQAGAQAPAVNAGQAATAALFEKTCSACHDLSQATAQSMDRAGWADTIARMIGYGAPLTPAQADQMADYLAATHGPAAKPGK